MQATVSNLNKARDAQHEYLQGVIITSQKMLDKMMCPCGGKLQFGRHGDGYCPDKCGHEFIIRKHDVEDDHATDEDGDPLIYTRETVYCRRKMNGHDWHIGELVTWWKDPAPKQGHRLNIPLDSPFYAWADYTGHDAVFLVIGVELSGDRVLVATNASDTDLDWNTLNPIEAKEITETTDFSYVGCFWCPIEYLESVSEWPYIDENA